MISESRIKKNEIRGKLSILRAYFLKSKLGNKRKYFESSSGELLNQKILNAKNLYTSIIHIYTIHNYAFKIYRKKITKIKRTSTAYFLLIFLLATL